MQRTRSKTNILLCILLVLQAVFSGCKYFSKAEAEYVISLHELALEDRGLSQLSRAVWNIQQTHQARINTYAFLHAKCFYQAQVLPSDGNNHYGIRLYFDRFGGNRLLQATAQNPGRSFAVLVDGFFVGLSDYPSHLRGGEGWIDLKPLWSFMEAKQIVDHVPQNYRLFNK